MCAKPKHLTLSSGLMLSPSKSTCITFSHSLDLEKYVDVADQRTPWEINKELTTEKTHLINEENERNTDQ